MSNVVDPGDWVEIIETGDAHFDGRTGIARAVLGGRVFIDLPPSGAGLARETVTIEDGWKHVAEAEPVSGHCIGCGLAHNATAVPHGYYADPFEDEFGDAEDADDYE
jgi:hypothetical protein